MTSQPPLLCLLFVLDPALAFLLVSLLNEVFLSLTGAVPVNERADDTCQPLLALAVRGPYAHSLLKDVISSLDPLLPKNTDPTSVRGGQDPPLVYAPPLASQVHRELCLWFSGRFEGDSAPSHSQPQNGFVAKEKKKKKFMFF